MPLDEITDQIMSRVEDSYRMFREGDLGFFETLDPEIEWWVSEALPGGGALRGIDEVINHFERIAEYFDQPHPDPEELIRGRDSVVVLGTWRARVKESGEPIEARFAHVGQYRDGKLVKLLNYIDSAMIQRASGRG